MNLSLSGAARDEAFPAAVRACPQCNGDKRIVVTIDDFADARFPGRSWSAGRSLALCPTCNGDGSVRTIAGTIAGTIVDTIAGASVRTIVLVACSSRKAASVPADASPEAARAFCKGNCLPARDMYRGALFQKARAYVEASGYEWRILSALHVVLEPGAMIRPYNHRLSPASYRRAWNEQAAAHLRAVAESLPRSRGGLPRERGGEGCVPVRFIVLAGADYCGWVKLLVSPRPGLTTFCGSSTPITVELPLASLGIGQQMAKLAQMTREVGR